MTTYPPLPQTRRTRFVCVSDTHNQTPQLPKGDVLIHAGDLTNQGSLSELGKTVLWFEKADFEVKLVVAGNHDITLDAAFYEEHGAYFHNQHMQDPEECMALLRNSPSITYLQHQAANVKLASTKGPHTKFKVFGSPYSITHGLWGFGYPEQEAIALWDQIPLDTDVLITHTPPKNHCDTTISKRPAGCEALRKRIWSVRPRLHICGHLHEGRGAERIWWKDDIPNCPFMEERTGFWIDPGAGEGNKKQSLVDLTEKGRCGWCNSLPSEKVGAGLLRKGRKGKGRVGFSGEEVEGPTGEQIKRLKDVDSQRESLKAYTVHHGKKVETIRELEVRSRFDDGVEKDENGQDGFVSGVGAAEKASWDTCIVNAAIMANSWGGSKRFNKPIVVDIDLPVWDARSSAS